MTYPAWICADCGMKHGRWVKGHVATFHTPSGDPHDVCGWCGSGKKPLTEPRDYRYPEWPIKEPSDG